MGNNIVVVIDLHSRSYLYKIKLLIGTSNLKKYLPFETAGGSCKSLRSAIVKEVLLVVVLEVVLAVVVTAFARVVIVVVGAL